MGAEKGKDLEGGNIREVESLSQMAEKPINLEIIEAGKIESEKKNDWLGLKIAKRKESTLDTHNSNKFRSRRC